MDCIVVCARRHLAMHSKPVCNNAGTSSLSSSDSFAEILTAET